MNFYKQGSCVGGPNSFNAHIWATRFAKHNFPVFHMTHSQDE